MTTAAATRAQSPEKHVLHALVGQMICAVNNRTAQTLKVSERWPPKLVRGRFHEVPNFPPVDIPAKTVRGAFRASSSPGKEASVEGTVTYQIGDDQDAWISIDWDIAWFNGSKNTLKISTFNEDVGVTVAGFSDRGIVESVTITVVDGR